MLDQALIEQRLLKEYSVEHPMLFITFSRTQFDNEVVSPSA
jgi:hypothetical protein